MTAYLVAISSHPSESLHIDFIITREIIVKIYQTSLKICYVTWYDRSRFLLYAVWRSLTPLLAYRPGS